MKRIMTHIPIILLLLGRTWFPFMTLHFWQCNKRVNLFKIRSYLEVLASGSVFIESHTGFNSKIAGSNHIDE